MKFTVLKSNFNKGLNIISKAVNQRVALPVLSNILIKTEEGRLKLTASDLQITISAWVGAKIDEDGEITIPAKILTEFVNQVPGEKILGELEKSILNLSTEKASAKFTGMAASEFPEIEAAEGGVNIRVKSKKLLEAINNVQFAAAVDEGRPVLTGIYLKISNSVLLLAATDGYRMAECKTAVQTELTSEEVSCILPAKSLTETVRAFTQDSDNDIEISINSEKNLVTIKAEDMEAQIRMIEGEYPDYEAIIPDGFSTEIKIARIEFLNGIKLANIFARDMGNMIKLTASKDGFECRSKPSETGSNFTKMTAEFSGEEIEIAFNARYMLDFLNNIDEEEIVFKATNPLKPGMFNVVGKENYFFIVMPMKADW